MSRNEEYLALLAELEHTPSPLEGTAERALARVRAGRKRRLAAYCSAAGVAACFLTFILLVNLSVPFARACGSVPVLRELAKAVAWSPSLSAAVENEYVQPIGESQTKSGITASVEYLIVDRKQVNIFYTLTSGVHPRLEADGRITMPGDDGGYSSSSSYGVPNGELRSVRVDFVERDVPDALELTLSVWSPEEEREPTAVSVDDAFEQPEHAQTVLAEFTFSLTFDPYFTAQGEHIPVNTAFTLGGQTLTLTEAELYPTHLRIRLEDDGDNTAWLTGLELYLENEHGERFCASANGISASGDPDGEGYGTFWLDSPFFSQGKHLTLYITRAKWREKAAPMTRLNLREGSAEHLPDGIRFLGAAERPGGWLVSFAAPLEAENRMYSLFDGAFYPDGSSIRQDITRFSSTYGILNPATGNWTEAEGMFTEEFPLSGFRGDTVCLEPLFDYVTQPETPLSVPIK